MADAEKEKQAKILAKLEWLTERSRRDFKGNPSPFEVKKTQQSVARERAERTRLWASDGDFAPSYRVDVPLAIEATRTDYLRGLPHDTFDQNRARQAREAANVYGPQRQRIDPETGLTEVQRALCWGPVPRAASDDACATTTTTATVCPCACPCCCHCAHTRQPGPSSSSASSASPLAASRAAWRRTGSVTLTTLPVNERAQAFRDEMLSHPKFTRDSAATHCDRWMWGSQLSAPVVPPPPRRKAGRALYHIDANGSASLVGPGAGSGTHTAARTRNPIRMQT